MGILSTVKRIARKRKKELIPFKEWNSLFCFLTDELAPLASGSEEKFLSIGSRLQDFVIRARELSEMSASVARLTSGGEIATAIEGLRSQLDEMTHYLHSSEKEAIQSVKRLQDIAGIVDGLDSICNEFKKIANSLKFLCVSIQIESARFNQNDTGFDVLSDNVRKLANLIEVKSGSILNDSKSLAILVQNAVSRTQELLTLQQGTAVKMLRETQAGFESLTALNKKSAEVSSRIATRSSEIYKGIGEVVTSMQFHDITRQEMEHVGKEITQLRESLEDSVQDARRLTQDQQEALAGWAGDVCGVQAARLFKTNETFVKAVDCVIDNLRRISKSVKEMVAETHALSGSTHQSGTSLLSQVENGILAVIQSLGENVKRANEISASVGNAVKGMVEFVKEIEEISAEIKLIALNAQVKANLAGDEGKALGIIAEEVQVVAVNARSHTADVLGKLRTIADEAGVTRTIANAPSDSGKTGVEEMVAVLSSLLNSLERINAEFIVLLGKITESGRVLGDEIETLSNQITFHKEMGETIDGVAEELAGIVVHSQQLVPSLGSYMAELPAISGSAQKGQEVSQCASAAIPAEMINRNNHTTTEKSTETVMGDNVEFF